MWFAGSPTVTIEIALGRNKGRHRPPKWTMKVLADGNLLNGDKIWARQVSGRGVARLRWRPFSPPPWAGASCAAAAQFLWIRNVWRQDAFLNIEPGYVTATDVMDGWQSAQWIFIDAPNGYAWIQNRWTRCYLHIERGKVECSTDAARLAQCCSGAARRLQESPACAIAGRTATSTTSSAGRSPAHAGRGRMAERALDGRGLGPEQDTGPGDDETRNA